MASLRLSLSWPHGLYARTPCMAPTVKLTSLAGLMSSFLLHLSVDELNPGGVL